MSAVGLATCYHGVCLQPQIRSRNQLESVRHHSATILLQRSENAAHNLTLPNGMPSPIYMLIELYVFCPPTEKSWLSCLDYLHENSEKQNSDPDLQRQLSQFLPAVGGCRVHDSEINPSNETQESESAQGQFHSAVIHLNKEGAWTHRCSLITHGARLHLTSVTWRSLSCRPRGSLLISSNRCGFFFLLVLLPITAFLFFNYSRFAPTMIKMI